MRNSTDHGIGTHFDISGFRGLRSQELDARVLEIVKPVICFFSEKGRCRVGGRGDVEGPMDRMLRFRKGSGRFASVQGRFEMIL
jgi:hypothetical protein